MDQDQLAAIDPYLKQDCVLYDDEHKPVMSLGALAPDGKSCIYDGRRSDWAALLLEQGTRSGSATTRR